MKKFNFAQIKVSARHFLQNNGVIIAWSVTFILIAGALQFYTAYPLDSDTPYHVAVGRLIHKYGILHEFPWTPFSWLSDRYADDKLIFHLFFVPLANLDWVTAARIVGTMAGASILIAFYLVLKAERVRFAGVWTLLLLAGSLIFIIRFILIRPHLLSITLALIFLWAAVRPRLRILALVSIIYPWAYVAFWQLPCLLLIAAETARFIGGERFQWRPAAVAAAGIAVGIAIHPNASNLLSYNWVVMYDVLFKNTYFASVGFDMGSELNPYPLGGWVQGLSIPVLMTVTAIIFSWRHRRKDIMLLSFTLAAVGFCILTIRSARFCEYFVPFSVGAFALASRYIAWRFLAPTILCISTMYTLIVGFPSLLSLSKLPNDMPPYVSSVMKQQIPPGSRVFTFGWNSTGLLLLTLPERYFVVALDPTLFYLKDPELYKLWYYLTHSAPPGIADTVRRRFGARYVIVMNPIGTKKFNHQLSSEPGVRVLLKAEKWLLFDLGVQSSGNELKGERHGSQY